jgi:hypothetical protein
VLVGRKDAFEKALPGQSLGLPDVAVVLVPHPTVLIKVDSTVLARASCASEHPSLLLDLFRLPPFRTSAS